MKKYTLYHVSEGTLFEASDTQPGQQFYLACDVDAFFTANGFTNWATQAARIAELEKALKEIRELAFTRKPGSLDKAKEIANRSLMER